MSGVRDLSFKTQNTTYFGVRVFRPATPSLFILFILFLLSLKTQDTIYFAAPSFCKFLIFNFLLSFESFKTQNTTYFAVWLFRPAPSLFFLFFIIYFFLLFRKF